ncbi:MAG: DUF3891 family protein [Actinobacteria bacterium]|nr:DUF3891 family protein [Actinomycetota bacterium]
MILQRSKSQLIAIDQADHARLSGLFAKHWNEGPYLRPAPWDRVVNATNRHDDGWIGWDAAPTVNTDGNPYDFITLPIPDRLGVYEEGIRAVLGEDPWTILLVSMHLTGLFLGRYEPGASRLVDGLDGEDRRMADNFLQEESARQNRLRSELGVDPMPHYRLLQVFDRLSLYFCMTAPADLHPTSIEGVPGSDLPISIEVSEGRATFKPSPFGGPFEFAIPAVSLSVGEFHSSKAFREALASGERVELSFEVA